MSLTDHRVLLIRHGETEWSRSGRHTSRTDLELTETGREQAIRTAEALDRLTLDNALVISSPRRRALDTARLAGLTVDEVSELLVEWDYGDYEGRTTPEIRESDPDWLVWTHGCPGGESVEDVSARAERAVEMALMHLETRDTIFVGHGHFFRAVIARWAELPLQDGIRFAMVAASIAVCGWEHGVRQISALALTGYPHPCMPT
ncbi:acid phosphatase [Mycolicibacterium doricum]|uniref:Acid phosphatase n=1 Tax=Mycolicibacterium doricum TaxID=126673 RepID=A0A1X1TBP6_9MYCO|nr:acid phosphatase [Mycolicibacterium doricum]MCV7267503.1 acid phosphatase [Mycolicibacterium doricum]ORV41990.1 acid phosphatase [Mycolicibacterium doricum]BBZ06785.1 acid phosphatase [Mycolicibacterium doricum]